HDGAGAVGLVEQELADVDRDAADVLRPVILDAGGLLVGRRLGLVAAVGVERGGGRRRGGVGQRRDLGGGQDVVEQLDAGDRAGRRLGGGAATAVVVAEEPQDALGDQGRAGGVGVGGRW